MGAQAVYLTSDTQFGDVHSLSQTGSLPKVPTVVSFVFEAVSSLSPVTAAQPRPTCRPCSSAEGFHTIGGVCTIVTVAQQKLLAAGLLLLCLVS